MKRMLLALAAVVAVVPALASAAVTVKGSDTMVILAQRWAEDYMNKNPGKKVQVTGGGSGTGIAALINGTTDIANASRSMKSDEKGKVRERYSVLPTEIPVAQDGVALYVNEANPVSQLTIDQLHQIYVGDVTNWKQVGGPDQRIVLYSRENSSGTYVFFKEHVLKGDDYAPAAQTLPGTAAVVNAVAKEKGGIGYGGAAYAKGVKEVKVVGADGQAYAPSAENVKSGKYPLARPLFMYTRAKPAGEVKAFIDYCLSPEGQQLVTKVGYFPIK
ncbi:phosphate ABC transporter substrate-binding protein [Anaeromyxobacter dehalogenans]|uniref:Phosphate-binding protein n=1 Tax=Anaeromyxobacter dehalogenans (strain 2CP-C) TaxID=290397 RepID=Q2IGR1_ANADE|nr:phosphate ABC transporter substrate-binding protein [Anaeromyxobacter dehalogenans]ABC83770.1 phosphate ABC transporter substrate-binding protein, PhoT family [Anaeromyxobacter dehalogenans 2CP-C]